MNNPDDIRNLMERMKGARQIGASDSDRMSQTLAQMLQAGAGQSPVIAAHVRQAAAAQADPILVVAALAMESVIRTERIQAGLDQLLALAQEADAKFQAKDQQAEDAKLAEDAAG